MSFSLQRYTRYSKVWARRSKSLDICHPAFITFRLFHHPPRPCSAWRFNLSPNRLSLWRRWLDFISSGTSPSTQPATDDPRSFLVCIKSQSGTEGYTHTSRRRLQTEVWDARVGIVLLHLGCRFQFHCSYSLWK